jgi:hypothetical protein
MYFCCNKNIEHSKCLLNKIGIIARNPDSIHKNFGSNICAKAAEYGHIGCLHLLHNSKFIWDVDTCKKAAENGNLTCLKYARKNGCPWNVDVPMYAAMNGHLDCLMYAHNNGCLWDGSTINAALHNGYLDCLVYAITNGCKFNEYIQKFILNAKSTTCRNYILNIISKTYGINLV